MLSLSLVALAAKAITANVVVDDNTCYRTSVLGTCEPKSLCEYNYNIGDLTFDQSCRVKDGVNFYPQQIHLAFAGKKAGTAMTVSWATFEDVPDSSVWVGESEDTLELVDTPVSSVSYYSDKEYNLFHHHALVTGLTPRTKYFYKVGSRGDDKFTSDISTFMTARPATDESTFNALIYGDLGDGENSVATIANINKLTSKDIDLVYHLGDISYADDDFYRPNQAAGFFYEEVYNKWMNSLMPLMSRVPYMVLVGNHEAECHSPICNISKKKKMALGNYTAYNTRFKMPYEESGGTLNMWYSFNHGPIHFTSLSSETDYPGSPTNRMTPVSPQNGNFGDQLAWIEADLKKADANRANVPWIFVGLHRPLYSVLNSENDVPNKQTARIQEAFEKLLLKYKVDVVLAGHKHYYERDFPVAKNKAVMDGVSDDYKVYDNPQAPVHILTGGAGQVEGMSRPPSHTASWNAVSDYEHFGYSMLEANRTALVWRYVLSSDQSVQDEFVMYKTESDSDSLP
ncbi:Calcineurin-like phosphoesterase [Phytophthora palmivora]|uniref:Purple acid phosphatase n=1 Tax=Phytophthora palmivora TaxID=4796 RepID=A0A2P4XFS7_9STRA|nr:Calcineurin-like phosphoesterase [Phytophthora palmivora]